MGSVARMTALFRAWEEFRLMPFPDSGYTLQIGDADAVAYDSHMSGWVNTSSVRSFEG